MESIEIAVSKNRPLTEQISETGRQVRYWLEVLDVPFNHAMDKLQLEKRELRNGQVVHHYGVIRGSPSFMPGDKRKASTVDKGIHA